MRILLLLIILITSTSSKKRALVLCELQYARKDKAGVTGPLLTKKKRITTITKTGARKLSACATNNVAHIPDQTDAVSSKSILSQLLF